MAARDRTDEFDDAEPRDATGAAWIDYAGLIAAFPAPAPADRTRYLAREAVKAIGLPRSESTTD